MHKIIPKTLALLCCVALGACITGKDPVDPWTDGGGGNPSTVPGEWLDVVKASATATFMMGSPAGELCRDENYLETQHQVTLTHGFEISASVTVLRILTSPLPCCRPLEVLPADASRPRVRA